MHKSFVIQTWYCIYNIRARLASLSSPYNQWPICHQSQSIGRFPDFPILMWDFASLTELDIWAGRNENSIDIVRDLASISLSSRRNKAALCPPFSVKAAQSRFISHLAMSRGNKPVTDIKRGPRRDVKRDQDHFDFTKIGLKYEDVS